MQNLLSVELVSIFNSSLVNVDVGNLINNDWIVTELCIGLLNLHRRCFSFELLR